MIIGILYAIDFHGVENYELLNTPELLTATMEQIILVSCLSRVAPPIIHRFSPQGLTYVAVLAQSHIAAHTWPEYRTMNVDFFTCGDPVLSKRACEELGRVVPCTQVSVQVIERRFGEL